MKTLRTRQELADVWISDARIGLVPTMGALHDGHAELIRRARRENDVVVVSVFVNPTQFNSPEDFQNYPNSPAADAELLRSLGVDVLFQPSFQDLYPTGYAVRVQENEKSKILCGAFRPGHFEGVLTVVMKLLNFIRPTFCYMGEKDYQQLVLVQDMVAALFMDVRITSVATVREPDGLAKSSRNVRLTPAEREIAPALFHELTTTDDFGKSRARLQSLGFRLEYLEEHWGRRFIAAHLGSVRLIDNVPIPAKVIS
jgi:pantoate--beta-alanine ligase